MSSALLLCVRFYDGRYHGQPEWPPSPARLFQALVAGAARGKRLDPEDRSAFAWLEQLAAPIIVAPAMRVGRGSTIYVPNNDLDAVGGDPRRVSEIRTAKLVKPRLLDARLPLVYAWTFEHGDLHASRICTIAERLYQLGRGIDMAWAWGEIVDVAKLEARLHEYGGVLHRPSDRGEGRSLACPQDGSLDGLERRFRKSGQRFTRIKTGRKSQELFSQAPKPRFGAVDYNSPPQVFLFELRQTAHQSQFATWPLTSIAKLVETVRNGAATKLEKAYGKSEKEKVLVMPVFGLRRDTTEADKAARIKIVPLPSIGSVHLVPSIRRVLVEVPPNCPLSAEDVAWSFSGLDLNVDYRSGEVLGEDKPVLVSTDDQSMLLHYGADEGHRVWRTVTPAVLPESGARRRIDPRELLQELAGSRNGAATEFKEAKSGRERLIEEDRAVSAVVQALRHAGRSTDVESIRVQREPFEGRGARAEAFAASTRFAKERLWHVEIVFAEPERGALMIGDGRYLGFGLMQPVRDAWRDVLIFRISPQAAVAVADGSAFLHAVRRALMALARDGRGHVPRLFSGHEDDGERAASGRHEHVFLAVDDSDGDGRIDRLIIAAPWACDHAVQADWLARKTFDDVVSRLASVRAGRLGVIFLGRPLPFDNRDPLVGPARVWESRTAYHATRHAGRRKDPSAAIVRDVMAECARRRLPNPEVDILHFSAVPNGGGLSARARLRFATAVRGPLLLGRNSHKGGGVFAAEQ